MEGLRKRTLSLWLEDCLHYVAAPRPFTHSPTYTPNAHLGEFWQSLPMIGERGIEPRLRPNRSPDGLAAKNLLSKRRSLVGCLFALSQPLSTNLRWCQGTLRALLCLLAGRLAALDESRFACHSVTPSATNATRIAVNRSAAASEQAKPAKRQLTPAEIRAKWLAERKQAASDTVRLRKQIFGR